MTTKAKLKKYFEAGDRPTQDEFYEWLDSYWHKEERIPEEAIDILEKVIPRMVGDMLAGLYLHLTLPNYVKSIASGALAYDNKKYQILEMSFNEGLEMIGMYSFYGQSIRHIKTPSTLKEIGNGAFQSPADYGGGNFLLEKITLNEGLKSIQHEAFLSPNATYIKDLYIPNSVIYVGDKAFSIPSLTSVSAPAGLDLSIAGLPSTAVITYR